MTFQGDYMYVFVISQ